MSDSPQSFVQAELAGKLETLKAQTSAPIVTDYLQLLGKEKFQQESHGH